MIEQEELLKKLEEQNKKAEELAQRIEKANAEALLSGRAPAGQQAAPTQRPMTDTEYANAFRAGKVKLNQEVPLVNA